MVASRLDSRATSSCSRSSARRFSDLISSRRSYIASIDPNCWSSCAAVFSPMPGTPGMLSEVSPLRPMKSGMDAGVMPKRSTTACGV